MLFSCVYEDSDTVLIKINKSWAGEMAQPLKARLTTKNIRDVQTLGLADFTVRFFFLQVGCNNF